MKKALETREDAGLTQGSSWKQRPVTNIGRWLYATLSRVRSLRPWLRGEQISSECLHCHLRAERVTNIVTVEPQQPQNGERTKRNRLMVHTTTILRVGWTRVGTVHALAVREWDPQKGAFVESILKKIECGETGGCVTGQR